MNVEPVPLGKSDKTVRKQVTSFLSPAERLSFKFAPSVSVSPGSQLCELIPNYRDLQENLSPEQDEACGRSEGRAGGNQAMTFMAFL